MNWCSYLASYDAPAGRAGREQGRAQAEEKLLTNLAAIAQSKRKGNRPAIIMPWDPEQSRGAAGTATTKTKVS